MPSIPPAPRSTSGFPLSETRLRPSSSSRKPAGSWSSPAAGHHRRRQPVLPEGDRGAEAGAETGTPMPLSNLPVFKQCCGTGSSMDQAGSECQPRSSIIRWSLADDSRLRGSAYHPERPSEVVAERRCPWADPVHPGNPRIEKLNSRPTRLAVGSVSPTELFLQHNPSSR